MARLTRRSGNSALTASPRGWWVVAAPLGIRLGCYARIRVVRLSSISPPPPPLGVPLVYTPPPSLRPPLITSSRTSRL